MQFKKSCKVDLKQQIIGLKIYVIYYPCPIYTEIFGKIGPEIMLKESILSSL